MSSDLTSMRWFPDPDLPSMAKGTGSTPVPFERASRTSAAAARGAAVQALVAAAVADHDRAAFGAARRVLLDLERDVRGAQGERHGARPVAVRAGLGRSGVAVGGHDGELVTSRGGGSARARARSRGRGIPVGRGCIRGTGTPRRRALRSVIGGDGQAGLRLVTRRVRCRREPRLRPEAAPQVAPRDRREHQRHRRRQPASRSRGRQDRRTWHSGR